MNKFIHQKLSSFDASKTDDLLRAHQLNLCLNKLEFNYLNLGITFRANQYSIFRVLL